MSQASAVINLGQPVQDAQRFIITSGLGSRTYLLNGKWVTDFHDGIDLNTPIGIPCIAMEDGTVVYEGYASKDDPAIICRINYGNGIESMHAHLSRTIVNIGQKVKRGQIVGYTGNTGKYTTGAHLHLRLLINGKAVDYRPYLGERPQQTQQQPMDNSNILIVQPGEGISHIAKRAGFQDWATETRWNEIARLNGKANYQDYKLNPNDRVRVRPDATPTPASEPEKVLKSDYDQVLNLKNGLQQQLNQVTLQKDEVLAQKKALEKQLQKVVEDNALAHNEQTSQIAELKLDIVKKEQRILELEHTQKNTKLILDLGIFQDEKEIQELILKSEKLAQKGKVRFMAWFKSIPAIFRYPLPYIAAFLVSGAATWLSANTIADISLPVAGTMISVSGATLSGILVKVLQRTDKELDELIAVNDELNGKLPVHIE